MTATSFLSEPIISRHSLLVSRHFSLVSRQSLLVSRHFSLVSRQSSLVSRHTALQKEAPRRGSAVCLTVTKRVGESAPETTQQ